MADRICVAFDDPTTADRALTELTALQKEYLIELQDACVVARSPDGEVHLHQAIPLVKTGAMAGGTSGALWGTLIGLMFLNPLAGMEYWAARILRGFSKFHDQEPAPGESRTKPTPYRQKEASMIYPTPWILAHGLILFGICGDALAQTVCPPNVVSARVSDVVVSANMTCSIQRTLVSGDVEVREGATLMVLGSEIIDSIEGNNAERIVVRPLNAIPSSVGQSIEILNSTSALIDGTSIGSDLELIQNDQARAVRNNVVYEIVIRENIDAAAIGNKAGDDLLCTGNASIVSRNNFVGEDNLQQCAP
jgi:hypothetical protein